MAGSDESFTGAKIAILHQGHVLSIQRDDRSDIPWPGHWDLPGGGREGDESPLACAFRETEEELSLRLAATDVVWQRCYVGAAPGHVRSWFLVARPVALDLGQVALGNEGQRWRPIPVTDFLTMPGAVPHLQARLADFLGRTGT